MNTILIPFDFSQSAKNALNYSKKLFLGLDVTVYLLNVYISRASHLLNEEENEEWFDKMDNETEDELTYLVKALNNEDNGITYKSIVEANELIKSIKSTISKYKIDLLITGTRGAESLAENFIGTNTSKMINVINCPIIVVPVNYTYTQLNTMVFSTNFRHSFTNKELQAFLSLSILNDCAIEVVNLTENKMLTDNQLRNKTKLREIFSEIDATANFVKLDLEDSETKTIEKYINEKKREMLVLIKHRYNFFSQLLEENVIKKSIFHSKVPILILPELIQ
ncbi:universal stress protein [Tenacibaculum maritimum]|uniref:universal stress protein n=1 Tax=Tenacibaculum maritimum TaxID=107401 RepID=UPI0012E5311F|nr:universal stress protein [Tenacibaculum maritimum]MCD9564204.1 universal stress protein [Tenacibaculum maritimum]MCD9565556.1 universal stress protein [Tenacibaculum maritimum]MCD9579179.1 universal stress protein [Tenacibaculum maritimum]MCD9596097.1 universal stress protein [Tenacibaculum maritimum]MCD9613346.1 universal stress protein [Tenacibaculum maritimum]